ncbi:lipid A deacylase LpxR family protein [Sediminibacterium soli]|uniref:lipid A deacylase LpxR family protein n=1 Tax=Sediminibacterium soli TaxID=2698829 RepID=UPI00137A30BE|nr:lipid A deacylase LpxR family protein [Sediminibacterium soli]NCI47851.1 lipid A deacylase LpxR family protein [Sediminibacterium soli]
MRMMRWCITVFFSVSMALSGAQEPPRDSVFRHEVSFVNENDAYLFRKHDAYYTNGIFLFFRYAKEKQDRKLLRQFELGQMIYTPLIRKTQTTADIDRPYCGFLYGRYQQTAFSKRKEGLFQYSITLGTVGEASLGENVQDSYHALFGYGKFTGWQYQVQNAIGIDLGISYAQTLWEDSAWIKLVPLVQASLGMNYTNASAGMYVCFGAMEKNRNSALWNASVQASPEQKRKKNEWFLFWYPELTVQGYNATLQGGLFAKGQGAVLADPRRVLFQHTAGLCYASSRITLKAGIVFEAREAVQQKNTQQYGSLMLAYRMK